MEYWPRLLENRVLAQNRSVLLILALKDGFNTKTWTRGSPCVHLLWQVYGVSSLHFSPFLLHFNRILLFSVVGQLGRFAQDGLRATARVAEEMG